AQGGQGRRAAGPARWGGVARRGAGQVRDVTASGAWRAAGDAARRERESRESESATRAGAGEAEEAAWQPEEWVDEGAVRDEAAEAVGRGRKRQPPPGGRRPRSGPRSTDNGLEHSQPRQTDGAGDTLDAEVRKAVGGGRAPRFEQRMRDAGAAFRRGRHEEARRLLRPLVESAPRVAPVRELHGLALYRLGRWKAAAGELEAFRTMTGSVEQHPVLADCYRAMRRYDDVDELWRELSAASPGAALVAEGRIVAAGALADQGRVRDAIRLLEPGVRPIRRAKEHHLRVAYALADLYERAGDHPQARELFRRIASADPDFVDVEARLQSLR
ncbi:MAG: tetratricopeptide repeat protein, partial [Acidimicrobiales bacterium]